MFQQHSQPEEASIDVTTLVKRLNSHVAEERQEAEFALRVMGPGAVASLLELMRREHRAWKRRHRVSYAVAVLILSVFGFLLITGFDPFPEHRRLATNLQLGAILISWSLRAWSEATSSHKTVARAVSRLGDIRAVGPLAESLVVRDSSNENDTGLRSVAEAALIRLLPRLRASDASLLNEEQRRSLNRVLKRSNQALILAILKAYEQVGDATAIPAVSWLADRDEETSKDTRIGQAARICLSFLEQRAEQQQVSQTLLRASTADAAPGTLLRPVAAMPDSDPQELLRPGGVDQTDP